MIITELCIVGENIISVLKMQNNYWSIELSFFHCCDSNIWLFSIAPFTVISVIFTVFTVFALPKIAIALGVALFRQKFHYLFLLPWRTRLSDNYCCRNFWKSHKNGHNLEKLTNWHCTTNYIASYQILNGLVSGLKMRY